MLLWVHLCLCNAIWQIENISTDNLRLDLKHLDQPISLNDVDLHWTEVSHYSDLNLTEIIGEPAALMETVESINPNTDTLNVTTEGALVYELGKIIVNEYTAGRNETDDVLQQLQYYYLNILPDEEDDNINYYTDINPHGDNSINFGMSVIVQFLLEFYRIFRKMSSTQSTHTQLNAIDVYGLSYDNAVHVMKAKKEYVPLEICAPLGQSTDIFKSILHKFVQMVQMECREWAMNWQSIILYLADLISDCMNCPNIWYNFVHILLLRAKTGMHETFAYKIAELVNFKELANYQNIFEFFIEKLVEYREVGRVQLSAEAVILTMLADMEENGLLNCVSVKNDYSR